LRKRSKGKPDGTPGKPSKKEILELRKQMMKSKVKRKGDNFVQVEPSGSLETTKRMPSDLMQRLAAGEKTQVDKKEMKVRASKNYENLPEVKRKKEEERKKEDLK